MSAQQTPSARDAFTRLVPAPPSVITPEGAAGTAFNFLNFPPIATPTPAGDESAPLSIGSPTGGSPF